ncbi:hypothetical protein AX016_0073 [Cellulophaga sp. RHA19]|nr:hypothetical protein AX016_0073 [Cellulophaga sp. RHA19]
MKSNLNRERKKTTQQVAKEKQYRYYISIGVYLPFELYLNDILIKHGTTGVSSAVELNPWLLNNGTYKVTIKFFPDVGGDTVVNMGKEQLPYRLDFYKVIINDNRDIEQESEPINLPLITTNEDLPYFKQSWDIEVKDLPYELEGWQNGQDLSTWDKETLQKKVIAYYEKLRTILNNGDANSFNHLCVQRDKETNVFNYDYNSRIVLEEFENSSRRIREYAKGNMVPIKKYTIKIYGKNNQLVSLERVDKENMREGVLRTLEPDGAIRIYNIKLYLPKDSDEFVIIRK